MKRCKIGAVTKCCANGYKILVEVLFIGQASHLGGGGSDALMCLKL